MNRGGGGKAWLRHRKRVLYCLLAVAAAGLYVLFAVRGTPDPRRCVSQPGRRVVAASYCQQDTSPGAGGYGSGYVWYYGGSGSSVGSTVQGGSFTPPEDDSGDNSNSNPGDDDSGDDDGGDGGDGG